MMFELPEYLTLASQMNTTLPGKTVFKGSLGNSPHKFVWYNRSHAEFEQLTRDKRVSEARVKGRWLFVPLDPGFVLVLGECGGKILYHPPGSVAPQKYHLLIEFADGASLSATTQMWGAMELYISGEEHERQYIKGMRPTPVDGDFTLEYFRDLIAEISRGEKRSVKGLLTQDQIIPGLGNAIAQDIMFKAKLHPRRAIEDLSPFQEHDLYSAICATVNEVTGCGGRYDEFDLFGRPGGYTRLMDKNSAGKPCPRCGTTIEKMQYLGGACYFCPNCQQ
jgi:formamidopyrimidine-DNA glycosylase